MQNKHLLFLQTFAQWSDISLHYVALHKYRMLFGGGGEGGGEPETTTNQRNTKVEPYSALPAPFGSLNSKRQGQRRDLSPLWHLDLVLPVLRDQIITFLIALRCQNKISAPLGFGWLLDMLLNIVC